MSRSLGSRHPILRHHGSHFEARDLHTDYAKGDPWLDTRDCVQGRKQGTRTTGLLIEGTSASELDRPRDERGMVRAATTRVYRLVGWG